MLVLAALLLLGFPLLFTLQMLPAEPSFDDSHHQLLREPPPGADDTENNLFPTAAPVVSFCRLPA